MEQYNLVKPVSIKSRKRVGRGTSSGCGKTCSRGMNGQLSRSGSKKRAWFEGGQMPIQRRVPKRGFNNLFKETFQLVNVSSIDKINDSEITPEVMKKNGLIRNINLKVKVMGDGDLTRAVTIKADKFTGAAIEKIQKAGGSYVVRSRDELRKSVSKAD